MNLFSKLITNISKKIAVREVTPQLTVFERRAMQWPSAGTSGLNYAAIDLMEQDAMIRTTLNIKRLGVLTAPWKLEPSDESPTAKQRLNFVNQAFARMEGTPESILDQAMDAFAKGWSVQECIYLEEGGSVWLRAVHPKDPSRFGLDLDEFGNIQALRLFVPGEDPMDLPRSKYVIYRNRYRYGRPKGTSDLESAYVHWQAKQKLLAAWAAHLDKFASPTMLGSFQPGLSSADQDALLGALNNLATNRAIVYPSEIKIDSIGGKEEASTGFLEALDFHNREIARAVLGQTLTTDEGRRVGSLALGKVHLQILLLQLQALRREIADLVMNEQIIRPLVELNFGPGFVPKFKFEEKTVGAFVDGTL